MNQRFGYVSLLTNIFIFSVLFWCQFYGMQPYLFLIVIFSVCSINKVTVLPLVSEKLILRGAEPRHATGNVVLYSPQPCGHRHAAREKRSRTGEGMVSTYGVLFCVNPANCLPLQKLLDGNACAYF